MRSLKIKQDYNENLFLKKKKKKNQKNGLALKFTKIF